MTARFQCAIEAAYWRAGARQADADGKHDTAARWLRHAARWRARGKALPRRIGMVCARARRRYRKRMQYLGRCHRQGPMPERLRSKRLDATFTCVFVGHDPANADDYTGNVFCSRCGALPAQDCDAIC